MRTIYSITQKDIDPTYNEHDLEFIDRHAVRVVLLDKSNRVALLYSSKRNYYKLPGGGVEGAESPTEAIARELLEEVGASAEVIGEIGRVDLWLAKSPKGTHQIDDAYLAKVVNNDSSPAYTVEEERDDAFSVVWIDGIKEAIGLTNKGHDSSDDVVKFMTRRDSKVLTAAGEMLA